MDMYDHGYRLNVGMVIFNSEGQVFWAKRAGRGNAWQFPQGGIHTGESTQEALFRELFEEVGLRACNVHLIAQTRTWLRYRLPHASSKKRYANPIIGQKQKWFLLYCVEKKPPVNLHSGSHAEFSEWCWVNYWHPLDAVVYFKRRVYEQVLKEFEVMHTQWLSDHTKNDPSV